MDIIASKLPAASAPPSLFAARGPFTGGDGLSDSLNVLIRALHPQRQLVHAGDVLYRAGAPFTHLYVLNSGIFKLLCHSADGREQLVGLKFRGDWLGFSAISRGRYVCDAVAVDTGEVWALRYDTLLRACSEHRELMTALHEAMSGEIMRDRDSLMSVCTLPADARVADFLRYWADSLATRGLRTDQITMHLTRAEIGNYLGMTLETVSRSLTKLERIRLIRFTDKSRREVAIPDVGALEDFIQQCLAPEGAQLLQ